MQKDEFIKDLNAQTGLDSLRTRQRKSKDICGRCFLLHMRCICEVMNPMKLRTRLSLVIHYLELKRTTNTGRLAVNVLDNSEMIVRGREGERVNLRDSLQAEYHPLFLFPSDDAEDLTPDFLSQLTRPVQLFVPDGNWRQASKVYGRHPEISDVQCVKIGVRKPDLKFIRKETRPLGMSTLQAIAFALGIIEGSEVEDHLLKVYHSKWEQTLMSRGCISEFS